MPLFRIALFLLALGLHLPSAARPGETWIRPAADLPLDPTLHWGRLDNGLRYVLRRQPVPPGAVSLRLLVPTGSLHESPAELGFAHFVEHLAFNDTRRFPRGALARTLERAGIRFGPHLTAFTWPSHTIYQIDLPANDAERLDLGLTVLREWADGVRFSPREVKAERGVLIAELQARGEGAAWIQRARQRFLYAGTVLAERPVGADAARIRAATPAELERFYRAWYFAENLIVLVIGDLEPEAARQLLERAFGDLPARGAAPPELDPGAIGAAAGPTVAFVTSRQIPTFNAELVLLRPTQPDSLAQRRQDLALAVALHALNRRFEVLHQAHPERFGQLSTNVNSPTPFAQELVLQVEGRAVDWTTLLGTLEQEWRRLCEHGVGAEELAEARANLQSNAAFGARFAPSEGAAAVADRLVSQIIWRTTATSATFNADWAAQELPLIDGTACAAALAAFARATPRLFAYGQIPERAPETALQEALTVSAAQPVAAPAPARASGFAYRDFGPPGAVRERRYEPSLDLHLVTFANGVRLNLKRTPFEAGSIHLQARVDSGGRLLEPPDQPGLALLAQSALLSGGLQAHDADSLRRALAGQTLGLNFALQETSFLFHGGADSQHIGTLLQLLTAYLSAAAVRDNATLAAKQSLLGWIESTQRNPEAAVSAHALSILTGGDRRFRPPSADALLARRTDELAPWIQSMLAVAPIEVGLVGDLDIEEVVALAAATLGTLPDRGLPLPTPPVRLQQTGGRTRLRVQTSDRRAMLLFAWPVSGLEDVRRTRTLEVLAAVLQAELNDRVREQMGLSYAIDATFWKSESDRGRGFLQCSVVAAPRSVRRVTRAVEATARTLQRRGVTPDALQRARAPLVDTVDAQLQNNSYWISSIVSRAQSQPETLAWPLSRKADLAAITPEEINQLARDVLVPARLIVVSASP